jgi:hypothetical protein
MTTEIAWKLSGIGANVKGGCMLNTGDKEDLKKQEKDKHKRREKT